MEVLKEKVEEEEAAEREAEAEQAARRAAEKEREDVILTREDLIDLEQKLSEIEVHIPEVPASFTKSVIDTSTLPASYRTNTAKEQLLLQVADNFARQYAHLCPDREPLFLHPLNECDVPKFVSTTIRPTLMPYPELYNWDTCAEFVSDFLTMVPLLSPISLPEYLFSPTSVLKHQKGNCFDFSILLCSFLIGAGYDAYCVSGYASQDICSMDLTREVCPLLKKSKEVIEEKEKVVPKKYTIKPPRDLRSKFELAQIAKKEEEIRAAEEKKRKEEEERQLDLTFDLGDPVRWEFLLLGTDKPYLSLFETQEEEDLADEDDIENLDKEDEEKNFDMPGSWVEQISISPRDFETRCPQGRKVIQYKQAKLEKWTPYLNGNGLVSRLTIYENVDCRKVVEVKEWYKNREDLLEMRQVDKVSNWTTEYFKPGHFLALRVHTYKTMIPETDRTMEFYHTARVDGLVKRSETPRSMTEYYEGRPDFLVYRHVDYGVRTKKFSLNSADTNPRPMLKITERFNRNLEKLADDDVAERIFMVADERIQLRYHCRNDCITTSKREFQKRNDVDNKGNKIIMTPDMCISYEVEPREHTKKLLFQYELMMDLKNEEKLSKHQVWESEMEVLEILKVREEEEDTHNLTISIYDTKRNEKSKEQREALERQAQEEHMRQVEAELDYLAPFLVQLPPGEKLTRWQALRLKDECLNDFKQRLIDKANLIQARFEKETQELQKKQQWYQENQVTMTVEDEEAYLTYCSQAMFRIRILEQRLNRHKELAPQKYLALEEKLYRDPRLIEYLKVFV
ncbi:dynein regulatory complex subunit 7 isoform X2 [Notamacropus eugenii]|uniref:dynein regulatory complex subunit 7 isoform X2 n=1 Tax=Notamacropus eugenii TaxID=9315 RepID=UPI003B672E9C